MKLLTLKVVALLAPFVALSVPTLVHSVTMIAAAERSSALRGGVFDAQLEGKLRSLVTADTEVIVAGDSRAERELVPAIVEARSGRKTVNIASTAQDLVTLSNALARHPLPANATLIVDISVFQVNDGAIDPPFLSTACLLNMTTRERVTVYVDRLGSPWSSLAFRFVEGEPAVIGPAMLRERGFLGIDKQLSLPLPKMLLNEHPWYRKMSLHGARWRIFQEALGRLAASGRRIYLFQPPISPAWRRYTSDTFVDTAERNLGAMLGPAAAQYPNVRFLDFYSADPGLGDAQFYDIQHLNRGGAAAFTGLLMDRIGAELGRPAAVQASVR